MSNRSSSFRHRGVAVWAAFLRLCCLLLGGMLLPGSASAWSGILFEISNFDSDWEVGADTREAQMVELVFRVEDKTASNLAVGAQLGYLELRLVPESGSPAETTKFSGDFIGLYLRQPVQFNDWLAMHGMLSLRYNTARESSDDDDRAEVEWTSSLFELGLSLRFGNLRITPYGSYHDVDGDISDAATEVFELEDSLIQGIRFDYFIEDTAFIQLAFSTGSSRGGYLNFVRRY